MVPASFSLKVEAMQIPILAMSRDYTSWYAPRGNSVGVAISQPRVEVRSASTLGKDKKRESNAVSIAISRRRYPQQVNGQKWVGGNKKIEYNAYG